MTDPVTIDGIAEETRIHADGVGVTLHIGGKATPVFVPLLAAETIISHLRRACDDVMRIRQQHGAPPSTTVLPDDVEVKLVVNLVASQIETGEYILAFRHPDASTTAVLIPAGGLAGIGSELSAMAAELSAPRRPS